MSSRDRTENITRRRSSRERSRPRTNSEESASTTRDAPRRCLVCISRYFSIVQKPSVVYRFDGARAVAVTTTVRVKPAMHRSFARNGRAFPTPSRARRSR